MPTLTIRNLPLEIVERLKLRARSNGRSMEQEAREILGRVLPDRSEVLSEILDFKKSIANPPSTEEIGAWVAEARRGRRRKE